MGAVKVLVVSAGAETGSWLAERLSSLRFEVRSARPGPGLIRAVRENQPHLAVIEGIHARPEMASMEVALLKDHNPEVQIIALSDHSSEFDAPVVEQGLFCYLGGCSREELLRVIEAAIDQREFGEERRSR
jgi:DNA-binding NtrC family response regulator